MAADWIKMRGNLWDDPRVSALVDATDTSEAAIVGGLYWLWSMADQHTEDGFLPGLSLRQIDRKTGIAGFGVALEAIGWIEVSDDDGTLIKHFEEHNGASAKKRAQTARRVAASKAGNAPSSAKDELGNADSVTEMIVERYLEKEKEKEKEEAEEGGAPSAAAERPSSSGRPPCPHQKIIEIYHEVLPELRRVREWNSTRRDLLARRWAESQERQNLEWWSAYFGYVRASPFLMGRKAGRDGRPFDCDLEWLIRPNNFAKVVEGKYEDQAA